ncbi:MAG: XRE family transcriptional regulator [Arachnia sp.]
MDEGAETLARAIGGRVRRGRNGLGWTLDRLAEEAGLSRRMLVNVEQGAVNPSVGTLLRLAEALGVGLPSLVEPPTPRTARVTRHGEGAVLWVGERGGRGVLVAGTDSPDAFELWDWSMAAGESHSSEAHRAGTWELLHVLEGAVVVEVDGVRHELSAGDALTFRGDTRHSYAHAGDGPARFALSVFEPGTARPEQTR